MYGELTPCLASIQLQCTCSPIHSPREYKGCGHRQPRKGWNGNGPETWLSWLASKRTARNCTQPRVSSQVSQVLSCWGQVRDPPMPSRPWAHPAESPGTRHVPLTIMQRTYLCHAAHYTCPSLAHNAATHAQLLCLRLKYVPRLQGRPATDPCRSSRARRCRRTWQLRQRTRAERVRVQQVIDLACDAPCDHGGHEAHRKCGALSIWHARLTPARQHEAGAAHLARKVLSDSL